MEAVQLHGVYMPESILLDSTQRSQFIQTCASNGINAIFFDLKNDKGYLTYQSSLSQAAELGSQSASAVDLSQVTAEMEAARDHPHRQNLCLQGPAGSFGKTGGSGALPGHRMGLAG